MFALLPTSSSKIKAKWSGPFPLVEVLSNNNYKLDVGGRQGVLHINQLRKFAERENERSPQTDPDLRVNNNVPRLRAT